MLLYKDIITGDELISDAYDVSYNRIRAWKSCSDEKPGEFGAERKFNVKSGKDQRT